MTEASERVLDVALRMFADESYAAVSMRRLADALDIQAPSIYSHFTSKSDLLTAGVGRLADQVDKMLDAAPATPVSPQARRAWLSEYLTLLFEEICAVRLAILDPAVVEHPQLGPRLWGQHDRLADLLCRFGVSNDRLAVAIIGSISLPLCRNGGAPSERRIDDIDMLIQHAASRSNPTDRQTDSFGAVR
jgi:AcrR family transcriptional regulator